MLNQALEVLGEEARRQFEDIRIPFQKLRCRRNELTTEDTLYAVAHKAGQYVIYDGAEGDFGLAVTPCSDDDVLCLWVLANDLAHAMQVLESGDYSRCLVAP